MLDKCGNASLQNSHISSRCHTSSQATSIVRMDISSSKITLQSKSNNANDQIKGYVFKISCLFKMNSESDDTCSETTEYQPSEASEITSCSSDTIIESYPDPFLECKIDISDLLPPIQSLDADAEALYLQLCEQATT